MYHYSAEGRIRGQYRSTFPSKYSLFWHFSGDKDSTCGNSRHSYRHKDKPYSDQDCSEIIKALSTTLVLNLFISYSYFYMLGVNMKTTDYYYIAETFNNILHVE